MANQLKVAMQYRIKVLLEQGIYRETVARYVHLAGAEIHN